MDCEDPQESWLTRMRRKASKEDVPLTGMIELTCRCNFRCGHCYAGPACSAEGELTTEEWKRVLDEAAGAGCLELVISGGEPLLRSDFADLYVHARRLGMEVTVFTNAALVDERIVELFHEWPPLKVEVSVYGLTEPISKVVTGVSGAAEKQWAGIRLLKSRGIPVSLKLLALTSIWSEIDAIQARAKAEDLKLRISTEVTPRRNGDIIPLNWRLDPETAAELESLQPGFLEALKDRMERRAGDRRRYPCAAGQYGFFVDAQGFVQPCLAITRFRKNVRDEGLIAAWKLGRDAARSEQRKLDRGEDNEISYKSFICTGLTEWGCENVVVTNWRTQLAFARQTRII